MPTASAAARSSRPRAWILIAITVTLFVVLLAIFDLDSQFRLRQAAHDLASAAVETLARPPAPARDAG